MYIILGIIVAVILVIAIMYNSLINKKNQVENAFKQKHSIIIYR